MEDVIIAQLILNQQTQKIHKVNVVRFVKLLNVLKMK